MSKSTGHNNVSFLSYFMLGELEKCLELLISTGRLPEAAFFARTYMPSQTSRYSELSSHTCGRTLAMVVWPVMTVCRFQGGQAVEGERVGESP